MKKKALEKRLSRSGWWLDRHGGSHDIWTNGKIFESVPRHAEINENLLRKDRKDSGSKSTTKIKDYMEFEGKVWKDKKHWLAEVPALNIMTQGRSRKNALDMLKDAILELICSYFKDKINKSFDINVNDYGKEVVGIEATESKLLLALSLIKQREKSGSTVREVAERLESKSPNSYAQYERGRIRISLDKYDQLLKAANPQRHSMLRVV